MSPATQLAVPKITPYTAAFPETASMTLAGVISCLGLEAHVTVRLRLGKCGLAIILARRGVIIFLSLR